MKEKLYQILSMYQAEKICKRHLKDFSDNTTIILSYQYFGKRYTDMKAHLKQ